MTKLKTHIPSKYTLYLLQNALGSLSLMILVGVHISITLLERQTKHSGFVKNEDVQHTRYSFGYSWRACFIFNWFRCYHTRCDNRHRTLSRWFQLDYRFFELANQTQRYINFEYRKINNHCFSSKSIFYFFLPFENNIIKSISYEIIQNNQ